MVKPDSRITFKPEQCGGRPCIRGLRIRVSDVLDLLANGLSHEQILEELPDLEPDDIAAVFQFAARRTGGSTTACIAHRAWQHLERPY